MKDFLRKIINQEAGGIGYDVEIIYANPSIGQIRAKTFYVNKAEDLSKVMIKFALKTYDELL